MWGAIIAGALKLVGFGIDMFGQSEAEKASERLTEQNIRAAELDIQRLNDMYSDEVTNINAVRSQTTGTMRASAAASGVLVTSGSVGMALVQNEQARATEQFVLYKNLEGQTERLRQEALTASIAGSARHAGANLRMGATALAGAASIASDVERYNS